MTLTSEPPEGSGDRPEVVPVAVVSAPRMAFISLIASFFVIAIGVQAFFNDRANQSTADALAAQRDRDAARTQCIAHWGDRMIEVLDARVEANEDLNKAKDERANALDDVMTVVVHGQNPDANQFKLKKDFDRAVLHYAIASAHLKDVRRQVAEVQGQNPYPKPPTLACGDKETS